MVRFDHSLGPVFSLPTSSCGEKRSRHAATSASVLAATFTCNESGWSDLKAACRGEHHSKRPVNATRHYNRRWQAFQSKDAHARLLTCPLVLCLQDF
jgi:hypothetical protein